MFISVRDLFQLGGGSGLRTENFWLSPNFQNEPTTQPCRQQNCPYYIFYAILKWHRNGHKQNNINWQYVKAKSAKLFLSDPRLWKDKDFCQKNGNVARRNWRCPNLRGTGAPPSPPGLYAHGNIHGLFQSTLSKADTDNPEYDVYFWLSINPPVETFKANAQMEVINHFRFNLAIIKPTNNSTEKNMRTEIYEILYFM